MRHCQAAVSAGVAALIGRAHVHGRRRLERRGTKQMAAASGYRHPRWRSDPRASPVALGRSKSTRTRQPLHNLHPSCRGVLGRQQRELRAVPGLTLATRPRKPPPGKLVDLDARLPAGAHVARAVSLKLASIHTSPVTPARTRVCAARNRHLTRLDACHTPSAGATTVGIGEIQAGSVQSGLRCLHVRGLCGRIFVSAGKKKGGSLGAAWE